MREAKEELGIHANFVHDHPLMVTCTETVGHTSGHIDVSLWYVLKGDRGKGLQYDKREFAGVKWFHHYEIPFSKSDPNMERFIKKAHRYSIWTKKVIGF